VEVVKLCAAGRNQFLADPNGKRQIREPVSMQVSDFPPSDPKENNPPSMRLYGNVGPGSDFVPYKA
jgi:hypothetical protein